MSESAAATLGSAAHVQIGEASHFVNQWGANMERTVWAPSRLEEGRCCGRKAHLYKKALASGAGLCCFRCDREYDLDGQQRPNYFYRFKSDGYYHREKALQESR